MNINGNWMNFAYMDNPTLYTSAYLVANIQGYTKHYYAGSERIASAIGLGGLSTVNNPIALATYEHKWENKSKALNAVMTRTIEQCLNHRFSCKKTMANLYNLKVATSGTMNRYFYHPDHLGSSSWITDGSGNAIQHLHYLPFGEDWVDQRNSSWNTPYTFSGKEKDVETGYGYFGARYYDSGLSIWLSVDPMSDKYPSMSPYNYCSNSPICRVDPDGKDDYFTASGVFLGSDLNGSTNIRIINSSFISQLTINNKIIYGSSMVLQCQSVLLSQSDLSDNSYLKILQHYNTLNIYPTAGNSNEFPEFEQKMGYRPISYIIDGVRYFQYDELGIPVFRIKGDSFYDDYTVVTNTFDHEKGHQQDRIQSGVNTYSHKTKNEKERFAIEYQINSQSFQNLTPQNQEKIRRKLAMLNN